MMNSEFILQQAQIFAQYILKNAGSSPRKQVAMALQRVTQRQPTDEEIDRGLTLLESLKTDNHMNDDQARKYFCLVALNLNEMMYLD